MGRLAGIAIVTIILFVVALPVTIYAFLYVDDVREHYAQNQSSDSQTAETKPPGPPGPPALSAPPAAPAPAPAAAAKPASATPIPPGATVIHSSDLKKSSPASESPP